MYTIIIYYVYSINCYVYSKTITAYMKESELSFFYSYNKNDAIITNKVILLIHTI